MSILAGLISGGYSMDESLEILDSRQVDAWSRIASNDTDFTTGLRFGKDHEHIEGYTHISTKRNQEDA